MIWSARGDFVALLALISAILAIVVSLVVAIGSAIKLPVGIGTGINLIVQYISTGVAFLYNFLPAAFWNNVVVFLGIIVAAHAAYLAYSIGISVWRIFQGGGD